jgi:hypothetical protein
MYITRALIGRNPCLDQAIQTRKTIVLLLFYKRVDLQENFGNVHTVETLQYPSDL